MDGDADDTASLSATLESNPHLALFQSMGKLLRQDPTAVIAQLSAWLSDENSPPFWAAFALSIRGLAYEVMDESELARLDYVEGLQVYDVMVEELGKEPLQRMESNINFVRFRLGNLSPPAPVQPTALIVNANGNGAPPEKDGEGDGFEGDKPPSLDPTANGVMPPDNAG